MQGSRSKNLSSFLFEKVEIRSKWRWLKNLLYSIAESAKANQLKPYEYFAYLLKELLKYPRENVPEEELKKLMPWSEALPDSCRKNKTR